MCARTRGCLTIILGLVSSSLLGQPQSEAASWAGANVGTVRLHGSATINKNGRIKVSGEGSGIGSSADSFYYFHQPLSSDGTVIARLASIQNTNSQAKAGLMFRQTLAAGSIHASILVTPSSGIFFQRRTTAGGGTTETKIAGTAPRWLRIARTGTTLVAAVSSDGVTWTTVGSASVPFSGTVYVGMAVTSAKSAKLMSAHFESVKITTPPAPALSGPVAAWSFDEGSGDTVRDDLGTSHGTISGAAWTNGRYGKALFFDGLASTVTVNHNAAVNLSDAMTVEAWVYPVTLASVRSLMMKEGSAGGSYALYAAGNTASPMGYVTTATGEGQAACNSQLALNAWSHVAATYDGSTLRVFVNGSQAGSSTISGALLQTTGSLRIGGNALWGEFFHGAIDNVRVYKRALSAAEIATNMKTAVPPAPAPSDTAPPSVTITAPSGGSTISGTVSISAAASDNVGVTAVQIKLNGTNLGPVLTSAPYTVSWDTTTVADGTYQLTATASDAAGNVAKAAAVTLTVSNVVLSPPPSSEAPRYIQFTSPDHNKLLSTGQWAITSYTLDIWTAGSDPSQTQPVRSTSLGRPPATDTTVLVDQQSFLGSLPSGQWFFATLVATGPSGSARSPASNLFVVP